MADPEILKTVRRKTRQRLAFALVTLICYLAYLLNYMPLGTFLRERLQGSWISGSLAMYGGLILLFIVLELIFLRLDSDDDPDVEGHQ